MSEMVRTQIVGFLTHSLILASMLSKQSLSVNRNCLGMSEYLAQLQCVVFLSLTHVSLSGVLLMGW